MNGRFETDSVRNRLVRKSILNAHDTSMNTCIHIPFFVPARESQGLGLNHRSRLLIDVLACHVINAIQDNCTYISNARRRLLYFRTSRSSYYM
jgi:hypothetical protein